MDTRQASTIDVYKNRGVWVPEGMTAAEMMESSRVLEREFHIAPYTSGAMVIAVLQKVRSLGQPSVSGCFLSNLLPQTFARQATPSVLSYTHRAAFQHRRGTEGFGTAVRR